ncbi:hypothetical protein ACQ4PT_047194 [Festuca glaucescens]
MAYSPKLALLLALVTAMAATVAAQNSPQDFVDPHNVARADVGVGPVSWDDTVAAYAQSYAEQRSGEPARALRRTVRGEHLLGLRWRRLVGGGRREFVGVGEAVLRPWQQHLRGGRGVRPLHTGGVARLHGHRLRACRLR